METQTALILAKSLIPTAYIAAGKYHPDLEGTYEYLMAGFTKDFTGDDVLLIVEEHEPCKRTFNNDHTVWDIEQCRWVDYTTLTQDQFLNYIRAIKDYHDSIPTH